jgi:TPP-dependent pyruvate/acetoin dehydrogenase alpha subunit
MATMTTEELIAFEAEIAASFNRGEIRAPIHLDGGSEDALIKVFENIKPTDWVCCSWRSHYRALLHGIPPEKVKAEIMAGRSIALCFPEHRFISSAIVGGILPIALGIALSIKRNGGNEKVFVFCGDMTAATGIFHECAQYASGHHLPIHFVVEDNGKSVCSNTWQTWGGLQSRDVEWGDSLVTQFDYKLPFPHAGGGVRVQF